MKANKDIRETLEMLNIKHWQLAEKLGISCTWLSIKLRNELPMDEKLKIFMAINELSRECDQ